MSQVKRIYVERNPTMLLPPRNWRRIFAAILGFPALQAFVS